MRKTSVKLFAVILLLVVTAFVAPPTASGGGCEVECYYARWYPQYLVCAGAGNSCMHCYLECNPDCGECHWPYI